MPRSILAGLAAALCCSPALPADLPTTPYERAPLYPTLGQAASAALDAARAKSDRFEHGGVLLRCANAYTYTAPVTSGDARSLAYRITVPTVCVLAGLYHTHLDLPYAEFYSDDDVDGVRRYGVPSFMSTADGRKFVLTPEAVPAGFRKRRSGDDQLVSGSPLTSAPVATATVATTATGSGPEGGDLTM